MPIRDGEVNNNDYWNAPRVKTNGLADINPEDIENISILKGASAAALYGSEAVNGVVLITSKSGKGKKGLGFDFSTSYSNNTIAFLPRFQYERGPGWTNANYSTGYLAPDGLLIMIPMAMELQIQEEFRLVRITLGLGSMDSQLCLGME